MANVELELSKVTSPEGLESLNKHLSYYSFVGGAKCASTDDLCVFKKLGKPPHQDKFPHVHRWYLHVASWHKNPPKDLPQGKFKVEEEKKEDDIDLFGDDDEEEDDALKKKVEALKASKGKKQVVAKSSLVIHIEPASIDTDLDEVLKLVKAIKLEGVTWGEASARVPLAYGIEKLQVMCTILDDVVNTNEIIELIECLGLTEEEKKARLEREDEDDDYDEDEEVHGFVQSATIVSFNKL